MGDAVSGVRPGRRVEPAGVACGGGLPDDVLGADGGSGGCAQRRGAVSVSGHQLSGPDIDQEHAAPGDRQETRDVLPPPGRGLGPQPERLRHQAGHAAREVQREQEPLLFQALEPVMAPRGHQELETGPVPLAGPPREVPPRLALPGQDLAQVAYPADGHCAGAAPAGLPPAFPARTVFQLPPRRFGNLISLSKISYAARRRRNQHRPP